MTTFLAFTTGLFGGILLGVFGKSMVDKLSDIMNVKDDEVDDD